MAIANDVVASSALVKLRRLPHVFSKMLVLPIRSEADVSVQETSDSFIFHAGTGADNRVTEEVRARMIQIIPGVVKIVIVVGKDGGDQYLEDDAVEMELDLWRFRLPASSRPEMTSARFIGGQLVVTVPKVVD